MCKKGHDNKYMLCINGEYFCEKCFDEKDYAEYLEEQRIKLEKQNDNNS